MPIWSDVYTDQPPNSQSPSLGAERIRGVRNAIYERLVNEHRMFDDGTTGLPNKDGIHKKGSATVYFEATPPVVYPNGDALDANATGKLWYDTAIGQLYVYEHGSGGSIALSWQFAAVGNENATVEGDKVFEGTVDFVGRLTVPVLVEDPVTPMAGEIWVVG